MNKEKDKNILGANIKKLRNKLELTQEQLSKKADISYTSLTKIETGVIKDPSVYTVAKIAKAFDVTIESLLINDEK
ncbi:helix-turn-helix transcriptional regulator [Candidatus Gracilibacteria bacterium]|nr:helix-turn-helix transcriptional regulator [Candidatus Gracilibacteria bacterium]